MAPQHLGDEPFRPQTSSIDPHDAPQSSVPYGPRRPRKKFVLCFDGTGNKFQGNDGDSNILKVFRMLDRETDEQCELIVVVPSQIVIYGLIKTFSSLLPT